MFVGVVLLMPQSVTTPTRIVRVFGLTRYQFKKHFAISTVWFLNTDPKNVKTQKVLIREKLEFKKSNS